MISELIHRRRSIFPKNYLPEKPIERHLLEQILENANWAPTHRRTEPWRFQVFHSEKSRRELGKFLANFYRANTPAESFSDDKFQKTLNAPLRSGAVFAIVMQRDAEARIPEFEEIASVAMAVQNMWLTCTELGLGSYWSTPKAALQAGDFLGLSEGQRCLGLFYIGWHGLPEFAGVRGSIVEKVVWR